MPKQIAESRWECSYCRKKFHNILMAKSCELSHEIIYVPLKKEDLMSLIQFLYTGEQKLLTKSLMTTLLKYSKVKAEQDDLSSVPD